MTWKTANFVRKTHKAYRQVSYTLEWVRDAQVNSVMTPTLDFMRNSVIFIYKNQRSVLDEGQTVYPFTPLLNNSGLSLILLTHVVANCVIFYQE